MKRLLSSALITTAVVALTACSAGSSRPTSAPSIDPDALMISAKDLKFSTSTLAAPANTPFQIAFDNQESAPHNVSIYTDASAATNLYNGEIFSSGTKVYDVPALPAGSYFFRCDVHPDMQGTITAQ